jgi:RHS repeat-associated protein
MEIEDNVLKMIRIEDGYLTRSGSEYQPYFYIRDHLGNNRATVYSISGGWMLGQEINYYPFGMLHPTGNYYAEMQPFKFGDRELDEMHGLNWYDQGARPFGAILPITPTPDPMAEKYYSMSQYNQWGNNPINRIDPTGMWIVGMDEKPVFYDDENGWSANTSTDVQKIGDAMMRTPEGKKVFNDMAGTEYGITINYAERFHPEKRDKMGETKIAHNENGEITGVTINLFDGKIQEDVAEYQQASQSGYGLTDPTEKQAALLGQVPTLTERIGQVGAHEGTHATNPQAMYYRVGKTNAEKQANAIEMKTIRQTSEFNRPIRPNLNSIKLKIK